MLAPRNLCGKNWGRLSVRERNSSNSSSSNRECPTTYRIIFLVKFLRTILKHLVWHSRCLLQVCALDLQKLCLALKFTSKSHRNGYSGNEWAHVAKVGISVKLHFLMIFFYWYFSIDFYWSLFIFFYFAMTIVRCLKLKCRIIELYEEFRAAMFYEFNIALLAEISYIN